MDVVAKAYQVEQMPEQYSVFSNFMSKGQLSRYSYFCPANHLRVHPQFQLYCIVFRLFRIVKLLHPEIRYVSFLTTQKEVDDRCVGESTNPKVARLANDARWFVYS